LSKLLAVPVLFIEDYIGENVREKLDELDAGSVVLLENLRFHAEEEANDPEFAAQLAALGDAYVNDAFGTAHRAHASTVAVPTLLPIKVAGFLMKKELDFLGAKISSPERPFAVLLGGAKVSDKIGVIDSLMGKCDRMLIGGAMAFTFLMAQGVGIGASRVERDRLADAKRAIDRAKRCGVDLLLPQDVLCTNLLDKENGTVGQLNLVCGEIAPGLIGVDIGPATIARYREALSDAKTIFWNGPMGIFEIENCAKGTFSMAAAVADSSAISIVGGGDSLHAIQQSGRTADISFLSTGGGASLELLEGKELPGVAALNDQSIR
jgi:3-phosphoglycerate kinase